MSNKIIRFERGIPGFLEEKEFELYHMVEESPFSYLQSVTNENLSFIVTSPFIFFPEYEIHLTDEIQTRLGIKSFEDVVVLTIVTIREQLSQATANLIAPIVVNQTNLKAEQIILENTEYSTRHSLLPQQQIAAGGK